jgi:hypothetical protein
MYTVYYLQAASGHYWAFPLKSTLHTSEVVKVSALVIYIHARQETRERFVPADGKRSPRAALLCQKAQFADCIAEERII